MFTFLAIWKRWKSSLESGDWYCHARARGYCEGMMPSLVFHSWILFVERYFSGVVVSSEKIVETASWYIIWFLVSHSRTVGVPKLAKHWVQYIAELSTSQCQDTCYGFDNTSARLVLSVTSFFDWISSVTIMQFPVSHFHSFNLNLVLTTSGFLSLVMVWIEKALRCCKRCYVVGWYS